MPKEVIPLDAFVGVDNQHLADDVFDLRVHPMREHHRLFLYLLEQVDNIGGCIGHPNLSDVYFPKSIS